MEHLIRRLLLLHYTFIKFLNYVATVYDAYRIKALNNEVVYIAAKIQQDSILTEICNKTGFLYGLYAVVLYYLGLEWLRNKVCLKGLTTSTASTTVVVTIDNGVMKGNVLRTKTHEHELPDALFASINDKYDVTKEYSLFRKSFQYCDIDTCEIMNILMLYKFRNNAIVPIGFWHKFLLIDAKTLHEYVLKGEDTFRIKHE